MNVIETGCQNHSEHEAFSEKKRKDETLRIVKRKKFLEVKICRSYVFEKYFPSCVCSFQKNVS